MEKRISTPQRYLRPGIITELQICFHPSETLSKGGSRCWRQSSDEMESLLGLILGITWNVQKPSDPGIFHCRYSAGYKRGALLEDAWWGATVYPAITPHR
jgi:hypothetical protein